MKSIESLHILIVEDHTFQLQHLVNCAQHIGIRDLLQAQDGIEALKALDAMQSQNEHIDVIICDLQMPNMDGVEFIRHLADREYNGALILLTAMEASLVSSITKMIEEYKLNFIGSLMKPVNCHSLAALLNDSINKDFQEDSPKRSLPGGLEEIDLIEALETGGLHPYFQPKFSFSDNKLMGFEALARLKLHDGRILQPNEFIYLYDQLDKTEDYEIRIYEQSFQCLSELLQTGKRLELSINFSVNMLGNNKLYTRLANLTNRFSIPSDLITVEITERSLNNSVTLAIEFLARLRINGFKVALDDFGTGYSSMTQLDVFPFNELKIDKSFFIGIQGDTQKQAIVQSTIELAERLNLNTTAVGIESQAAWEVAKEYGCDICQGYLTGRPMPKAEFISGEIKSQ